jgi:hypothetical protein
VTRVKFGNVSDTSVPRIEDIACVIRIEEFALLASIGH